jgi:hypothetical protein
MSRKDMLIHVDENQNPVSVFYPAADGGQYVLLKQFPWSAGKTMGLYVMHVLLVDCVKASLPCLTNLVGYHHPGPVAGVSLDDPRIPSAKASEITHTP